MTEYLLSRKLIGDHLADREFLVEDGRVEWVTNPDIATGMSSKAAFRICRVLNSEKAKGGHYDYSVISRTKEVSE